MVSMNRRFEPLLSAGRAWLAGRRVRYARAQMLRHGRTESQFVTETGLHVLDTVGWLAGGYAGAGAISADAADGAAGAHPDPGTDRDGAAPVRVAPPVGGVEGVRRLGGDTAEWYILDVVFAGGSAGRVEIFPSAGANAERYELTGDGWYLVLASSFFDEGLAVAREGGETVWQYRADPAEPVWRRTGTYDETLAFLDAVEGRCDFSPTPADVLPATRVAYAARRV
jgi:hypothetical protein